jgi:hypothetical protein
MFLLIGILLMSLTSLSQTNSTMNDINHRNSSDVRTFQKRDGQIVKLSVDEKICESFAEDGSFSAISDPKSKEDPMVTVVCKNKQRVELKTKDASGEMVETWKDGQRNGELRKTSDKGILLYEAHFVDGQKEGEEKTYFENGKISTLRRYKKGQLEGEQIDYDSFGKPSLKFTAKALRSHKPKKKNKD